MGGTVPMLQSLRQFDGTDPTYAKKNFLNAITAKMVTTAEPKQVHSTYHEARILMGIGVIQTA